LLEWKGVANWILTFNQLFVLLFPPESDAFPRTNINRLLLKIASPRHSKSSSRNTTNKGEVWSIESTRLYKWYHSTIKSSLMNDPHIIDNNLYDNSMNHPNTLSWWTAVKMQTSKVARGAVWQIIRLCAATVASNKPQHRRMFSGHISETPIHCYLQEREL
jgi:hypothetical protein